MFCVEYPSYILKHWMLSPIHFALYLNLYSVFISVTVSVWAACINLIDGSLDLLLGRHSRAEVYTGTIPTRLRAADKLNSPLFFSSLLLVAVVTQPFCRITATCFGATVFTGRSERMVVWSLSHLSVTVSKGFFFFFLVPRFCGGFTTEASGLFCAAPCSGFSAQKHIVKC